MTASGFIESSVAITDFGLLQAVNRCDGGDQPFR